MDDYYWTQSMDGSPVAASGPTLSALRFPNIYNTLVLVPGTYNTAKMVVE